MLKKFKLLNKYKIEDLHRIANYFFPKLLYSSIIKLISGKKLKKQNMKKKQNIISKENLKIV